jgi:hypothetical protein
MALAVVFHSCQRLGIKATSRLGESDVPRYFFHFSDGKRQFTDGSGQELNGIAAARAHATEHVREMKAAMSDTDIHDFSGWSMTVVDGSGKTVFEIGFDLKPPRGRS